METSRPCRRIVDDERHVDVRRLHLREEVEHGMDGGHVEQLARDVRVLKRFRQVDGAEVEPRRGRRIGPPGPPALRWLSTSRMWIHAHRSSSVSR
jgi:hypothetical protein